MNTTESLREHYKAVRRRLMGERGAACVAIDRKAAPKDLPKPEKPAPAAIFVMPARPAAAKSRVRREIEQVTRKVARRTGVTLREMTGTSRHAPYALARQRLAFALYQHFGMDRLSYHERPSKMSLSRLASLLGGRDHTTILHSIRREAERRQAMRGR